ncbi:MAG: Gfo/Idh/MocA family protein [Nakamurella sp.]
MIGQIAHLNDTVFVPTQMLPWSAGTSPVWFLMPHTLDLMLWLSGKTVQRVHAQGVRGLLSAQGIDTWDSVDASIEFTDGTNATLHSSWVLPVSYPAMYDFRYELVGSRAALRIESAEQGIQLMGDKLSWPQWDVREASGRIQGFPVDMAYDFVEHLLGRAEDVPTVTDGMKVTAILAAVDRSLASGSPVDL